MEEEDGIIYVVMKRGGGPPLSLPFRVMMMPKLETNKTIFRILRDEKKSKHFFYPTPSVIISIGTTGIAPSLYKLNTRHNPLLLPPFSSSSRESHPFESSHPYSKSSSEGARAVHVLIMSTREYEGATG
jgi:hypothetical protein